MCFKCKCGHLWWEYLCSAIFHTSEVKHELGNLLSFFKFRQQLCSPLGSITNHHTKYSTQYFEVYFLFCYHFIRTTDYFSQPTNQPTNQWGQLDFCFLNQWALYKQLEPVRPVYTLVGCAVFEMSNFLLFIYSNQLNIVSRCIYLWPPKLFFSQAW